MLERFARDLRERFAKKDTVASKLPARFFELEYEGELVGVPAVKPDLESYEYNLGQWQEWISSNLKGFKGKRLMNASYLIAALYEGVKRHHSFLKESKKRQFELPDIVFMLKNDKEFGSYGYNPVIPGILIRSAVLKSDSSGSVFQYSKSYSPDGKLVFSGTLIQRSILTGIEECDHADFLHGRSPEFVIRSWDVRTLVEYDAQPIELRALRAQAGYTLSHKNEFLEEEVVILKERIRSAENYRRKKK